MSAVSTYVDFEEEASAPVVSAGRGWKWHVDRLTRADQPDLRRVGGVDEGPGRDEEIVTVLAYRGSVVILLRTYGGTFELSCLRVQEMQSSVAGCYQEQSVLLEQDEAANAGLGGNGA